MGVGATKVTVIVSWWNGYEDEVSHVDFSGLKPLTCNYCGYEESIFYPAEWLGVEYVCPECMADGESEDYDIKLLGGKNEW